jgi:two-component system KDP operon response regulator KdpE
MKLSIMKRSSIEILIVDDEPEIRRFVKAVLNSHHYEVLEADSGSKALSILKENSPGLMILDMGLPDIDGVEVTRRARLMSQLPIIILSVRDRESDKIKALDAGADDYLTKPFGVGELLARIRGVLRRVSNNIDQKILSVDNLCLDLERHKVTLADQEIDLTPNEFDILRVLIKNAGKVITHRQLIHQVWGSMYENEDRMLRVNISNLRRKIEPNPNQPHFILTELGVGYRMRENN